ncbi:helix-turn-helix domain-containing protein [Tahibacter amnicola]|uniref:Helix-turn-helix transcriptional regulator n=1 Tax=Tahibacter amnicola TaxID=2976241 RepID=A0ABY6B9T0_9GAMM|nr:helix-turn-helix transcriptional regulator [Tahibacter amnicola]UXI66816.1 helix-turn-helix transcriptional regulator [Tahibacter amnicola]
MSQPATVGPLLREWRQRRHLSQLDLACKVEMSSRHLSFLETGRSLPSRAMLLRLCEHLSLPLRERNALLLAAGMAPAFPQPALEDPDLAAARQAMDLVLAGHEPYPALAVDRHWHLIAHNRAVAPLLTGVSQSLLQAPANVLRLSLHPEGLAPAIINFHEWKDHILLRLEQQATVTADPVLHALHAELAAYPAPAGASQADHATVERPAMVVPFRLRTALGDLSFIGTTTVFGTPMAVTLAEVAIESFFPADAATSNILRKLAEG